MLKYATLVFLGLLQNTEAATNPPPMSAWDNGFGSLLYYLRRDDDTDRYTPFRSTAAKFGHYYYPVTIGGSEEFNLQISTYGSKTAVVGKECRLGCKVPKTFDHGDTPYSGETILNYFKNIDSSKPDMGFYQQKFQGRYIEELVQATDDNKKVGQINKFRTYVMFGPDDTTHQYSSGESGYLGLGPYTTDNDNEKEDSFLYQLKKNSQITKNIATYNITFNANAPEGSQSYVQLGDISRELAHGVDWITTNGWNYWKSPVTISYFRTSPDKGNKMYPFTEFQANAIFDPSVDYMYVNQIEFDQFMQPILSTVYGDALTCNENNCYFQSSCDKVVRHELGLYFSISSLGAHYYQIQIQLEDYLINGKTQWDQADERCYLPIFVVDPGMAADVFTTWYLGNMFMDRYVVVHDMEGADDIGGEYLPRIGLYDKYANRSSGPADSTKFLQ